MNRGSLRTQAALRCADINQTRFSAEQYNDAINFGNRQFALDSYSLFKNSTITVVDATATYSLPSDFLLEKKVTHKGLKLDPISRDTLEFYKRSDDWSDDSGTPKKYMIDPEEARKNLLLYPIPTGDDAGANLILTYYPLAATLSDDTDTPLNGYTYLEFYHIAISAYAAWMLLGFEDQTGPVALKRQNLYKEYWDKVVEAKDKYGNTASEPIRLKGGRNWNS